MLAPRYIKCLSCGRHYVEKWWGGNIIKYELFLYFFTARQPPVIVLIIEDS
jgi:hypothetical protein